MVSESRCRRMGWTEPCIGGCVEDAQQAALAAQHPFTLPHPARRHPGASLYPLPLDLHPQRSFPLLDTHVDHHHHHHTLQCWP